MDIKVHSEAARWDRGVELAYAANEARDKVIEAQSAKDALMRKLVEPYVHRSPTDITSVWYPDRHCLYSDEVEKIILDEFKVLVSSFERLDRLVGKLIGRSSAVEDPYSDLPRAES